MAHPVPKHFAMKKNIFSLLLLMLLFKGYAQELTKSVLYSDTTSDAISNQLREFLWNIIAKQKLKESYIGMANIRFKLNNERRPVQVESSFGTPGEIQNHIQRFFDSIINIEVFNRPVFQNHGDKFYIFLFRYNFYIAGKPRMLAPADIMQYECMNRFVSDFTEQEKKNGFPDCSLPLTGCIMLAPVKFDNSPKPPGKSHTTDGYNIKAKLRTAAERNKPAS